MEPTYTAEQLEEMKAEKGKFVFEGKEYDRYSASQQQRKIERTIRKLKRRKVAYDAAGQADKATATNIRLRRLSKEYKDFSKVAGLPEQRERMKVLYA